jgi:hypothetical protein
MNNMLIVWAWTESLGTIRDKGLRLNRHSCSPTGIISSLTIARRFSFEKNRVIVEEGIFGVKELKSWEFLGFKCTALRPSSHRVRWIRRYWLRGW